MILLIVREYEHYHVINVHHYKIVKYITLPQQQSHFSYFLDSNIYFQKLFSMVHKHKRNINFYTMLYILYMKLINIPRNKYT